MISFKKDGVHWGIFVNNTSDKATFLRALEQGNFPESLSYLEGKRGALFTKATLEHYLTKENRHDIKILTSPKGQSLMSMSSGEQKRALLHHILKSRPGFILLDNPFDNLDKEAKLDLQNRLGTISKETPILQLISRQRDMLPFINRYATLKAGHFLPLAHVPESLAISPMENMERLEVPPPLYPKPHIPAILVHFNNVSVRYGHKRILNSIQWCIGKGEFWQLIGKNGSGKTTLLSMLTGENPKGYGQELFLFGQKKGTGESIWELKEKMGYFTPSMTDKFTGYHSLENMIVSGLTDSIGLYTKPTGAQLRLAEAWLHLIGLEHLRHTHFHDLGTGQKRLLMTARAMVKHPSLLLLDEPTAGMDDRSAALLVHLVNKMARESDTTLIFVSHRNEPGLQPDKVYELQMTPEGSRGMEIEKPS
ncbi:MAG: ATP-binding cassette domain-containing protein [Bacteroidota bacterium]